MSRHLSFSLTCLIGSLWVLLSACSSEPLLPLQAAEDTQSQTIEPTTENTDLPLDTMTDTATLTEPETSPASNTQVEGTESEPSASESETPSPSDTVPQDSDTIVYCPYLCQDNIGAETCSALGAHWVRHAGYLCEDTSQICCQALGQPGGVLGSCEEQPALSCRNNCGGSMIQRTDYYCGEATKVCCENPDGPTCTEMAGQCVSFLEKCPSGYSSSSLPCGSFIEKCCAPPICPWTCTPYVGEKTCSSNITNPTAIRNDQYACPVKGEICCQPMDAEEGINESCTDQSRMVCRDTCETYETANDSYYCKLASRACCEDVRPKCIDDLDGQCIVPLLGCPDGMEESSRGICLGSEKMQCCVDASPFNRCAQNGGTCVSLGSMCPPLTTMDLTTWCGNLTDICCNSIF